MGYFANGSEGYAYHARYCERCVRWTDEHGCPCWLAHDLWNYAECNKDDSILHKMIPLTEDGLGNETCFAFTERQGEHDED